MAHQGPIVRFQLRDHQRSVRDSPARFRVPVMHRRAGKSVFCVAYLMSECSKAQRGFKAHYLGPSYKQTAAIAWQYAIQMAQAIGGCTINKAELKITFQTGATLELLGGENADSLRGRYSNLIVIDEAQLLPQSLWAYVIRPLLADREGRAIISGTPAGWHNLLGWAYKQGEALGDWESFLFRYDQTDALDPKELDSMRREMSPEAFAQEMECDFNAAIQGAFYAAQMRGMMDGGRYGIVRHDKALPVIAALDLGHTDLMPVLWAQEHGTELRVIHGHAYQFTSIPDMVSHWRSEGFPHPDLVILPHDARVRDLTSGSTRQQVFEDLGFQTVIAPKLSLLEGIEMTRRTLEHTWIDRENAGTLFEALGQYRSDLNEQTGVTKLTPLHDWASHWADAFRYLVTGDRQTGSIYGNRKLSGIAI